MVNKTDFIINWDIEILFVDANRVCFCNSFYGQKVCLALLLNNCVLKIWLRIMLNKYTNNVKISKAT
jgi:hypothetical protein